MKKLFTVWVILSLAFIVGVPLYFDPKHTIIFLILIVWILAGVYLVDK